MEMPLIEFTDITFPIKKPVLCSVSSQIPRSKLVGILGPSGSGKTTLLKILSGRFTQKYHGDTFYEGILMSKRERLVNSVYVHQDDILLPYLTVKETISFYESLIVSKSKDLIGLDGVLTQKIGNSKSGISAGERKRLSILIGLLENKEVMFFDEPTSGLDALNALKLMNLLKRMNGTRICVVHQPSSEIFFNFDTLIIMHSGKIVYEGESKLIFEWFSDIGLDCPKYTNPADFIFTDVFPLLENSYSQNLNGYPKYRATRLTTSNILEENQPLSKEKCLDQQCNSFIKEFKILWKRNFKIALRNKSRFYGRCIQAIFVSFVIGVVYFRTYQREPLIRNSNVFGLLYFIATSTFFTSAMSSLPDLYTSEILLEREYQNRYYRYFSYFTAKALFDMLICSIYPVILIPLISFFTEYKIMSVAFVITLITALITTLVGYSTATIVASLCPNLIIASAILPSVLLPLTLLNGMLVHNDSLMSFVKSLEYISPTRYTLNILVRNHFDLDDVEAKMFTKNFVNFNFTIWDSICVICLMTIINLVLSCLFLNRKINRKI